MLFDLNQLLFQFCLVAVSSFLLGILAVPTHTKPKYLSIRASFNPFKIKISQTKE